MCESRKPERRSPIDGRPKVIPISVGIDEEADETEEPEADEFEEADEGGDGEGM